MTAWGWFAVASGGALGAMARFFVSHHTYEWLGRDFAWGTLAVNVVGSFIMGFMAILLVDKLEASPEIRSFIMVGFLGAFTTFSTFSFETVQYLQLGEFIKAAANIVVSVLTCLLAVWAGLALGRQLLTP
ncbi:MULTISPECIES: fluoride efflux transporter CrcB [Thiomicrorhabdus]|uniref:Fluoride-specific ion channel FluC n=1 Tax=Thiomicrorhabdus heinhorstiae TaxID=2748010 RepID=A0ABS0BZQ8_9GAMM|nr:MULTISPECIES: fluoride efflux transporter CrcB [Thiomicrorhabdus]MBF6058341.1 fluoride efflux transporter CrcB [Thiomicrorhabdus heinhorstiae]